MNSKLTFHSKAPWSRDWGQDTLLIYDRVLLRFPNTAKWIRRFPRRYGVKAGEELKEIRAFPGHVERIQKLAGDLPNRKLSIVVAGGGSVGDFGGFVAMTFKRGVKLVNVPTTWLAAIDSAHGGKNGLNVLGTKNQIGGIYPAQETHLVKQFLISQPEARAIEGAGEALKMYLLKGGLSSLRFRFGKIPSQALWKALPELIRGKLSIVRKDPFEKSGLRHLLNLGHTMGHVFESELKLPHGIAVAYGLAFAVTFSRALGVCTPRAHEKMISHPLWNLFLPSKTYLQCLQLPAGQVRKRLMQDKKRTRTDVVRFVFTKSAGQAVVREISVEQILAEYHRQRSLLEKIQ